MIMKVFDTITIYDLRSHVGNQSQNVFRRQLQLFVYNLQTLFGFTIVWLFIQTRLVNQYRKDMSRTKMNFLSHVPAMVLPLI